MKLEKTMVLGLASMLVATGANAAVENGIDLLQNATDLVETDYTGFFVGNVGAGSVAPAITVGAVTTTIAAGNKVACLSDTAEFTGWNARNRSPIIADSGAFTHDYLYAQRIGSLANATDAATGEGIGIYVQLDGLLANKAYRIQASGNDYSGGILKNGSFYLWDASAEVTVDGVTTGLVAIDSYTVSGSPSTIANNDIYSASGDITTDGSGRLIFKTTGTIDRNTLNGFSATLVPDGIAPPENLAGTTDGAKVDLDWSDDLSGTLASYSVFRSEGGAYGEALATGVLTSEYTDTTVVTGTTYYYVVTATDTGATETGFSNELEITPFIQYPTNLTAIPGNAVVDLDWDDNTSGILASYTVYRSESEGGPFNTPLVTGVLTSDYSDTSVTNGIPYYYVVTAIDNITADESANSDEISATPFTPITGSSLYIHLDASVADSLSLDNLGPVPDKVISWGDLTGNLNDASGGIGTVRYPSDTRSPTDLPGLDMGPDRNILVFQNGAAQDKWLDFSSAGQALPYSGFAIFVAVTADDILGGIKRDVVLSSVESKIRLGYEGGRPQFILNGVRLENSTTPVVALGDTVILAVNYDVATGTVELWDSLSGATSSITVPAADFSESRSIFLGGAVNGDQMMSGMIGEVKVYRGAMSQTEFEDERLALSFKWLGLTAPSGLTATPGNGSVELDWNDQLADSYEIYRDGELLTEGVTVSNYTDTGLTNGVTYEYTVVAIKGEDFSGESEAVSATPDGPPVGDYSAWQAANSTAEGLEGDHDLDRVQNGIEFFLGGNANTTGFTPIPGVVDNAGTLSVTWTKAGTYTGTYGTDFVVKTSTTLNGDWSPVTEGAGVTIVGDDVTYTFPSPSGKLFVRLEVTGP